MFVFPGIRQSFAFTLIFAGRHQLHWHGTQIINKSVKQCTCEESLVTGSSVREPLPKIILADFLFFASFSSWDSVWQPRSTKLCKRQSTLSKRSLGLSQPALCHVRVYSAGIGPRSVFPDDVVHHFPVLVDVIRSDVYTGQTSSWRVSRYIVKGYCHSLLTYLPARVKEKRKEKVATSEVRRE